MDEIHEHRWWTATDWRDAVCLWCRAPYVVWYELTQKYPEFQDDLDNCEGHS